MHFYFMELSNLWRQHHTGGHWENQLPCAQVNEDTDPPINSWLNNSLLFIIQISYKIFVPIFFNIVLARPLFWILTALKKMNFATHEKFMELTVNLSKIHIIKSCCKSDDISRQNNFSKVRNQMYVWLKY